MWLELLLQRFSRAKLVVHRRIGTRDIGIDPQLILVAEVYDEVALSLVMRASASARCARTRWMSESGWAMRHIVGSIHSDAILLLIEYVEYVQRFNGRANN
jgi:hypothetical protein